jgi:hypothetical protein
VDRRIVLGVLAIIAAVLIGFGAYQVGFGHGLASTGQVPAVAPDGPYGYGRGGFPGFWFFGLLFPILFILLIVALVRSLFGRPPGWGGPPLWGMSGRTMLDEWHRDAHGRGTEPERGSSPAR